MSELAFTVEGGQTVRLKTAGRYCDRDIMVTATGDDNEAAYVQGIADGKQAEYDRFWDAYQDNGNLTNYSQAFAGSGWTDEIFNPKYDLIVKNANSMFNSSRITGHEKILSADFSKCANFGLTFIYSAIEELGVIDFASVSSIGQTFQGASVKKIAKLICYEKNTFNNPFLSAASLTDVTFEGILANSISLQWSPLSKESILSCFSVLSDTATGKTATFKQTAVDAAFTADEWNALVATKGNWTITLA
ncbi:MAG: hypothetical protein J6B67_00295 [Oscillospiraceae bacterium]|nr:hypothetical protein [Oscillospiraceae bacterium]